MTDDRRKTSPRGHHVLPHIRAQTAGPISWEGESTDPSLSDIDQIVVRQHRQSLAIGLLRADVSDLKDSQSYQTGKLETIEQLAARAEERELTKLKLNRPVAIITALGVAIAGVVAAAVIHGCAL